MRKIGRFLAVCFCAHITLTNAKPLLFSVSGTEEGSHSFRVAQSMASEIADRCETKITLMEIPPKREEALFLSKGIDGAFGRVEQFGQKIPSLIRVPEPISILPVYAYSIRRDIKINGWVGLEALKIAYLGDQIYVASNVISKQENTFLFTDVAAGLNFVAAGRVDIFIHTAFIVESLLKTDSMINSGVKALLPPIDTQRFFIYALPKHTELAECFNIVLKKMKEDKTYERIIGELLTP